VQSACLGLNIAETHGTENAKTQISNSTSCIGVIGFPFAGAAGAKSQKATSNGAREDESER
jgi:hypothetical protein